MLWKYLLLLLPMFCTADILLDACRRVFATNDGAYLAVLSDPTILHLNNQLKKVVGIDPGEDWNLTKVRELSDDRLTDLLLLSLVGNYTTAASQSWQQPCRILINSKTGLFQLQDDRSITDEILSVLLIILCVIQLKQIIETE